MATEAMTAEQAVVLADFARACKAAIRVVSMYPATHPAIQTSLSRVVASTAKLAPAGEVTVTVHPDSLIIDDRAAARPDPSIGELAAVLHDRLVGALRIERAADGQDWHALLTILARPQDELIAGGGVGKAWAATGRAHFEIREIDYAEVLRERAGAGSAEWDRIIAFCLQGDTTMLDERSVAALLATLGHPDRLGELLERLDTAGAASGAAVGARTAAILQLLRRMIDATPPEQRETVLETAAAASARLTPEMLLGIIAKSRANDGSEAELASGVVGHITDPTIASFVAGSIVSQRGATERLAQAFEALVPEVERKERLLDVAKDEAQRTPLGTESGFEHLWQSAADMLTSYTDTSFVSAEYARELSEAKAQAIDVDRVSDDPPERTQAWLATVGDRALRELDLALLLDLLRIEADPNPWRELSRVVAAEIERRTLLGEVADAQALLDAVVRELGPEGRADLRSAADSVVEALASGPMVRHLTLQLRKVDDRSVGALNTLAQTLGTRVIRPMAEALAVEENTRAIRRLRELLLGFGAAGRASAEQLKNSSNPAVRRTAIDLLRVFGGREALPELASMLGDADPEVQRDAIRAIVQIGTSEAYAVLEKPLVSGSAARDTIVQQLIDLRDNKAIPLLCHVLNHTSPRGRLVQVHSDIIDALGGLGAHPESTRTLKAVLYRGEWWAPFRTAALRQAAATALRRAGGPDALAALQEAASSGSRGVRNAARPQAAMATRRAAETTRGDAS